MNHSVFIKTVLFIIQGIDNSYENSFLKRIIDGIIGFFNKINEFYENSIMAGFTRTITQLLYSSAILQFFFKRGNLSKWYENSVIFLIINGLINFPSKLLKKVYLKFENIFIESKIISFVTYVLSKFEIIAGLFIFMMIVIPHNRWDNRYSLIISFVLAGLVFINIIIQRNWEFNIKAIDFTLILFMVLVVLSVVASMSESSRFLAFYVTSFLFVLIIVSSIKSEKALGAFIEIILIGIAITGLYGVWQVVTKAVAFDPSLTSIELSEGMPGRIFSTMHNPNNYAQVLIMTLPFFAAVILNAKSFVKKVVYLGLALAPMISLFYTGSRSGWIGLAVAVFVFTFFFNKRLIPFVILGGVMLFPFMPSHVHRRLFTIFRTGADTSSQYRVEILQTFYPMLRDYYLWGLGLGTNIFMRVINNYHQYTKATPLHTHVLYLQIWIETGLLGILSFMWLIYRTLKNSIICMSNTSKEMKNILIAGVTSLAGVLTIGVVEYIWYYQRVMFLFWIVVGIVFAATSIVFNKNRKLSES
ncbi:UNVERIFIED_CONTAM: O-antigen ligase [Acetivibrio alkalicellulosi]